MTIALPYIAGPAGKTNNIPGMYGCARGGVDPTQMTILGIKSARVAYDDLIPIIFARIWLDVRDHAITGSDNRRTDGRGNVYAGVRASAMIPERPKGAITLFSRRIA